MSESLTAPQPDVASGAAATAVADRSWIRRVAFVALTLALIALVALVGDYLRSPASFVAAPESPRVAAMILAGVAALMALGVIVFRPEQATLRPLVSTSLAWSGALLLGLIFAWSAIATFERQDHWHGVNVQNSAGVEAYLAQNVPADVTPILIPTGILVKSLEFLNGDNVQVTGFIWQKYGPDVPKDLVRGVVLAEGVKDPYRETVAYQYEEDGVETIGWYFETTLRQPFEYAEYPFDEQDVWFRLWAKDFTANTILVPDFDSYVSLDPKALPGLEKEFVYSGWTPIYSGFTLSEQPYSTSFGIGKANQYAGLPELYFNLIIDRNFGGPFFEHFVFALAVMILLFGLLLLTTDDEDLKKRFQLSTAGVLGAASGLLFAVILKHNQLRSVVGTQGVSYIEMIPIVLYGVIVFVVVNAILLASPYRVKAIHRHSNLLPVLAYWPVIFGLMLAVTLIVFFQG